MIEGFEYMAYILQKENKNGVRDDLSHIFRGLRSSDDTRLIMYLRKAGHVW